MQFTFTSASTVKGFVKAIKNVEPQNVSAVCIGEQTAAEARKYGMKIQVAKTGGYGCNDREDCGMFSEM